jgi:hypothetical protein
MIVAVICGTLLLCCAGVGGGIYWLYGKARNTVQQARDDLKQARDELSLWNPSVNRVNYDRLSVGTTTRLQAELTHGGGKTATSEDIEKIFGVDAQEAERWMGKVAQNRVVVWRNGDDYILAAFHPNGDAESRLQMKEWKPKVGAKTFTGETSDTVFLEKYPFKKIDDLSGPPVIVSSEDLAQAFKDDKFSAESKYKDKVVLVEGKLSDINLTFDGEMFAMLEGSPEGTMKIRCAVQKADANQVFGTSRGQTIKFRGKCTTSNGIYVDVTSGKYESRGVEDPAVTTLASDIIKDYSQGEATGDRKYKDKTLTINEAYVESKTADSVFVAYSSKTKLTMRIKVTLSGGFQSQLASVKMGDRIKVKGECTGMFDNTIFVNRAWIVPK